MNKYVFYFFIAFISCQIGLFMGEKKAEKRYEAKYSSLAKNTYLYACLYPIEQFKKDAPNDLATTLAVTVLSSQCWIRADALGEEVETNSSELSGKDSIIVLDKILSKTKPVLPFEDKNVRLPASVSPYKQPSLEI